MSDIAALVTASAGVLTICGGGIAFVWNKVETGLREVRAELKACQKREADSARREATLEMRLRETSAKHLTVIELLWQEIERRSRGTPNAVLGRARRLLDDLKEGED